MLTLTDIGRRFNGRSGPVQALQNATLTVGPGELVVVRGPSGCGKTTLLLTAGGLLMPDVGRVCLNAQDLYALSPDKRAAFRAQNIGFVFQQFHLIPYLTACDNVLAPTLTVSDAGARDRAMALLARFGLSNRIHHLPAELSTGEKQRTALARALLNNPKLLLADEPTGNLDPKNAGGILEQLRAFADAGGCVLLVTHASASVADRVFEMEKGHLKPSE